MLAGPFLTVTVRRLGDHRQNRKADKIATRICENFIPVNAAPAHMQGYYSIPDPFACTDREPAMPKRIQQT